MKKKLSGQKEITGKELKKAWVDGFMKSVDGMRKSLKRTHEQMVKTDYRDEDYREGFLKSIDVLNRFGDMFELCQKDEKAIKIKGGAMS